jgi:hypothetical protein
MAIVAEWNSKPQIPCASTSTSISLGSGELPVEITIGFLGTWDTYKSLKAVTKSFSFLELLFG